MTRDSRLIAVVALISGLAGAGCAADHPSIREAPPEQTASQTGLAFVPDFPGAGKSGADAALPNGRVCDSATRVDKKWLRPTTTCFFQAGQTQPAATIEQVLECAEGRDAVHLRLTFDPGFVDNSFGDSAIGWDTRGAAKAPLPPSAAMPPKPMMNAKQGPMMDKPRPGKNGHSFMDLVGSDHAEFVVTNEAGEVVSQFKLDYVSKDATAPSGYASLGVLGGDGKMLLGDAGAIVDWQTSIELNLNDRGYAAYTTDSPGTDADYTPNDATENWDYRVVYEVWIDNDAFGDSGFGGALVEHVHASPSKAPSNTIIVVPGECTCQQDGGCAPPPLMCELTEAGCDEPEPACEDTPDDPNCQLL